MSPHADMASAALDSAASASASAASGSAPPGSGAGAGAARRAGPGAAQAGAVGKDVQKALAYILRSTQARPQTEAEIAGKLRAREVPDEIAEAALREAKRVRAIDDAAFACAWVEDRGRQRGFGGARLRQELRRRKVPDELVDDALRELDGRDDFSAAAELARSRLRQLPARLEPEAAVRRLTGFLVRRGYPPGLSQRVAISVSGLDRRWD